MFNVFCINTGGYVGVDGGESLLELSRRLELPFTPIVARVNNKNEALSFCLYQPKLIEFLPVTHPSGERAYIRSLCMVLYRAVTRLYPGARLSIEHSISRGYYCRLRGAGEVTPDMVAALSAEMRAIVERDLTFERREELTSDVIEIFRRQGLDDKVRLLSTSHSIYTTYYRLDGICDSYYGTLAPSTGMLRVWELRPFKDGFLLVGFDRADTARCA